jgi:hypothetical protein
VCIGLLIASFVVPIAAWIAFLVVALAVVIAAIFRLSARVVRFAGVGCGGPSGA